MAWSSPFLDAMINRIFHYRLKHKLQYVQMLYFRTYIQCIIQLILISRFLNNKITLNMLDFICERNDIITFAEPDSKQSGK